MTTGRRVVSARSLVGAASVPDHEAVRLLETATGRDRASLVTDDDVVSSAAAAFQALVARRRAGEPLQYLEGSVPFGPVDVAVDPRVLIPRPETEQLWELVTNRLAADPPAVVVDLGTGSGNLAIALKHRFPAAAVHAVDVSAEALQVARCNAATAGLDIDLYLGNLYSSLPPGLRGKVDLVISNPPYIAVGEHDTLPVEVRDHEPAVALLAGADGLEILRQIITEAPSWLRSGGLLACEIGAGQGRAVAALAADMNPEIIQDLSGRDRFLIAQKGTE